MDLTVAIEILLENGCRDLWSHSLGRERDRFLRIAGTRLSQIDLERLTGAILKGPSRSLYPADIPDEEFRRAADRQIWQRLAKLNLSKAALPENAIKKLDELDERYHWKLSENGSDEFSFFMETEWDQTSASYAERFRVAPVDEIVERLTTKRPDIDQSEVLQGWRTLAESTSKESIEKVANVLGRLVEKKSWDLGPWNYAFGGLRVHGGTDSALEIWKQFSPFLFKIPEDLSKSVLSTLADWLRAVTATLSVEDEKSFWDLWDRFYELSLKVEVRSDVLAYGAIHAAINHPAGTEAEALLDRLWKRPLTKGAGIPQELKPRFDSIANADEESAHLARVILASRLHSLFWLDPEWTAERLLTKLEWNSPEALNLWQGYLWAPRVSPELLSAYKTQFLQAFDRSNQLGEWAENLYHLFASICVNLEGLLSVGEMRRAVANSSADGLTWILHTFRDLLRGAENKAGELWRERIGPWLTKIWPTALEKQHPRIATAAAEMAVYSGDGFPAACVFVMQRVIVPVEHFDTVCFRVEDTDMASRYPKEVLALLDALAGQSTPNWQFHLLPEILKKITTAQPKAVALPEYKRLLERFNQN